MIRIKIIKAVKKIAKMVCPPAAKDLKLNTKNRDASIKAEHIKYGTPAGPKKRHGRGC